MITLSIFSDFCNYWYLWWILPTLLGLLFGWAYWGKWSKIARELEDEVAKLKARIKELEEDLEKCSKERKRLRDALSISENRINELKARIESLSGSSDIDATSTFVAVTSDEDPQDSEPEDSDDDDSGSEDADSEDNSSSIDMDTGDSNVASSIASSGAAGMAGAVVGNALSGSSGASSPGRNYDKLKDDNFQIIEGVDPKMESVLHENGITSWSSLASKSQSELQSVLDNYGDKYKIIDPSDWANQASFARDGNWDGLIAHQSTDGSDSKAEKVMIKLGVIKAWKKDDLKVIEGIGPKIEGLLHAAGISTWNGLAETSVSRLNEILAAAGKRYQLG